MRLVRYLLLTALLLIPHTARSEPFIIPNSDYLPALEYSCIKHVQAKRIFRALEILNVMNWQCAEKKGLSINENHPEEVSKLKQYLAEAREARASFLKSNPHSHWVCNPKPILTPNKEKFYSNIANRLTAHLALRGTNPSLTNIIIAQVAQETAWGTRIIGNNLFNIKGSYRGESMTFRTSEEYTAGKWTPIHDTFRKYPSLEASIDDYLKVLSESWPFSYKALFDKEDKSAAYHFIVGLKAGSAGGYATDKAYAQKLKLLANQITFEAAGGIELTYLKCLTAEAWWRWWDQ